jgi:hypothetical protein
MKSTSFTLPVVSFRNLETPFQKQGYKDYYAVVHIQDLPDFTGWRDINVRDAKLTGSVPTAIRTGFRDKKDLFLFMNRGIVLSVDKLFFDAKNSKVSISLTEPKLHGLLDGGHTYEIIQDEKKPETVQYVKVEILEGFSQEDITDVVDARNTSNQVRDESLMNLAGAFDPLKKALQDTPYFSKIAFKEFETDDAGNPKPIDVREIIAILTTFDREHFDENVHPINAYRSKSACLNHFKDNQAAYKKIYPIAKDVLALYDKIQEKMPDLYNKVRGISGGVSRGQFGKLTGVTVYGSHGHTELYYIGKKAKYGVPDGFVYPVLGAFRALLEEKAGRYVWGLDPFALLDDTLGLKLADTIGNFALDAQNPSKTGKSPLVWQACYQSAQVAYLSSK